MRGFRPLPLSVYLFLLREFGLRFFFSFTNDKVGGRKMNILNIELMSIEETRLGFEHWVNVTYSVLIQKSKYSVRLIWIYDL